MGWFDNDPKEGTQSAADSKIASPRRELAPTSPRRSSSTIGERVRIKGTIRSDEDLTILGKVEGTIHARQELLIAKGAEVKAVIHGCKIALDGSVTGDVRASETVILGATAQLTGNISTPSLEIREGAFFKGAVEMKQPAQKETGSGRESGAQPQRAKRRAAPPPPAAQANARTRVDATPGAKGKPPVPVTSPSRDRA